jgi:hypothetical protein
MPIDLPPVIKTAYPVSTHVATPRLTWEPRRFRVLGVRDLARDPLSVEEFLQRPMTRRSRFMVKVYDIDRDVFRSVYQRSMLDYFRETPLRVGVFRQSKMVDLVTTNWGPTIADRLGLVQFLRSFDGHDFGEYRLGIFSDDLEVITCDSLY